MNKEDLITRISEELDITKVDARKFIETFTLVITEALMDGKKVQLVGFGSFEVRDRKARMGRNPRNPEMPIRIPARKAPVFSPGKNLKEAVNA